MGFSIVSNFNNLKRKKILTKNPSNLITTNQLKWQLLRAVLLANVDESLILSESFNLLPIKADPRAILSIRKMKNERQLSTLTTSCTSSNSLKIALFKH